MISTVIVVLCTISINNLVLAKGFGPGEQDYGYVTVRPGAHMFWWLYHTTANVSNSSERPIVIWLQGGPGISSSGKGNFYILGPLDVTLKQRNHTWVKDFNILFVDNPVGTGFSFVDNSSLFATNNTQIATDLVSMLKGFYKALPQFNETPVYVYGQSYGGKMAVEFVKLLVEEVKQGNFKSNISGVALGDAWISPTDSLLSWSEYLYQHGYIDDIQKDKIHKQALKTKYMFDCGNYSATSIQWETTVNMIKSLTTDVDFYNIHEKTMLSTKTNSDNPLRRLMNGSVKKHLNIIPENLTWEDFQENVINALDSDTLNPVADLVEFILKETHLKVHVYNGNLDLLVNTPGQLAWVNRLEWPDQENFKNAQRKTIVLNNTVEGYEKTGGKFSFFWINAAGHAALIHNPAAIRYTLKSMTGF